MKAKNNPLTTVIRIFSILSLSLMAAFLQSLKTVHPHLQFHFSAGTIWSFVLTAIGGWFLWQILFVDATSDELKEQSKKKARRAFLVLCWTTGAWMIFQFAISMKGLAPQTAGEITEGGLLALAALSALAYLMWKITRGFNDPGD